MDNQVPLSPTILTGFVPQQWGWANITNHNTLATLEITEPGLHTLYLWIREDGLRLDRVLLTTDSAYTPVGSGPPESEVGPDKGKKHKMLNWQKCQFFLYFGVRK